jgi:hypothetical protein
MIFHITAKQGTLELCTVQIRYLTIKNIT